ncbi:arylamine N-acetyltransferase family protein [Aquimarina litoralis]|uniref:arylamine N-acetyltransferase family protein n=1 Tax=Aquimarina litoralis TaxID=584605 RepID=UPI001FE3270D|nr:arylamine N-acetyltransferase [Aquimarina litoralis]
MIIKEYLNRINYQGNHTPNLEVLKELQKGHLLNVPFENLDIHYNRSIDLDASKFYKKIVIENRGGFCYELNGLFQILLNNLGFKSKIISARVYDSKKEDFGEEYDHLAIIVELDQNEYLVDVGFGEFTFHPLIITPNKVQKDPRGNFIIEGINGEYTVSKINGDIKSIEYKFTTKSRELNEFQGMCNYHQTNPNSHFTQKKLITKPINDGRVTLTGNTLKITKNNSIQENIELSKSEYTEQLFKWFQINEETMKF